MFTCCPDNKCNVPWRNEDQASLLSACYKKFMFLKLRVPELWHECALHAVFTWNPPHHQGGTWETRRTMLAIWLIIKSFVSDPGLTSSDITSRTMKRLRFYSPYKIKVSLPEIWTIFFFYTNHLFKYLNSTLLELKNIITISSARNNSGSWITSFKTYRVFFPCQY